MSVTQYAAPLIKEFEGCKLKAYKCPADVWTIGYGHTGKDVTSGLTWTQDQADEALAKDIETALTQVQSVVKYRLSDKQLAALVSFVFNLGIGNFSRSSLLKRINDGDLAGAQRELGKWTYAGGKHLPGLARRREAEAKLFRETV